MKDAFLKKLGRHVADAFEAVRLKAEAAGEEFIRTPYVDELVSIRDESLFPLFECGVRLALAARVQFRQEASPDVPELPLSSAEWEKMISGKSNEIALVGFFGRSWACANWGPHPVFREYARGVMASEDTPERIRADPVLLRKFPPKPLGGLDPSLCWGVYERIFDLTQQLIRAEESWRYSGLANAAWLRSVLEQLVRVRLDQKLRDFLDAQPERRT